MIAARRRFSNFATLLGVKVFQKCEYLLHLTKKKKVTLYSKISATGSGLSATSPNTGGEASAHPDP